MLVKICSEEAMPERKTVYTWMGAHPAFKEAYARARLAWADWWAERVLAISLDTSGDIFIDDAGKAVIDHANVQRARLQTDSIKWLVGKYAPRTYGDKPQDEGPSQQLAIRWIASTAEVVPPPPPREPPRQLVYHRPEMPGDLSPQDWSILLEVLELLKRTLPTNDERPPEEVFRVLREALLAHFREHPAEVVSAQSDAEGQ
jgi:hypothetical protein